MNPEILLEVTFSRLYQNPPAGLVPADVEGFFARNRTALLEAVRKAFPTASIEPAFTRLREEHRLARLLLEATQRHLDGAAYSSGSDLADLLDALDDHVRYEDTALFPYLGAQVPDLAAALDHARAEHAELGEHLFALTADLRAGRRYQGPAIPDLLHHFAEEEAQIVGPALAAGLARTPAGTPGRLLAWATDIERLSVSPPSDPPQVAGEPTRWGGRRGRALQPGEVDQNTRIVTEQGEHGLVTEVHAIVVTSLFGGRRDDDDVHYSYTLKLDSGRTASPRGQLYEELTWPTTVVPDIQVGERWVAPTEVWSQVTGRHRDISAYAEKADNARKPEMKRQWQRHSATARKEFLELVRLLTAWRWAHPSEPVEGLDERRWRLVTLEARDQLTEDERWELAWLKRVPPDWATRFKVGDRVVIHVLGPHGRQPDPGWTVAEVRGHQAILSRDENLRVRVEPLWMLKPDDSAPLVETFTEPRYLRELASEMLIHEGNHKPYPTRGAVARAVKTFLAENGIQVSTRVGQGSMVTGIDLRPPTGEWSATDMARMRALLPGLKVWNGDAASLEPWETTGESYDPYGDYRGKSAGLRIPVAHLPRFAVIFAGAMKAEGQALNQLGERRLAAGTPARAPSTSTRTHNSATADQRAQAAEGCRDLDFDLPGYGHIRVVCGEQGRRDTWFNIFHGAQRYGFNGGRWARNLRPPDPILAAIRERGVTTFS